MDVISYIHSLSFPFPFPFHPTHDQSHPISSHRAPPAPAPSSSRASLSSIFRLAARIISSLRFCSSAWRSVLFALQDLRGVDVEERAGEGEGFCCCWAGGEEVEASVVGSVERRFWRL